MKKFIIILFWILISNISFGQNHIKVVDRSENISLLEIFWLIQNEYTKMYHSDGDCFYKTYVLNNGESETEGERSQKLFVLKGEYGEAPDGKLFDLGNFTNIFSIEVFISKSSAKVHVIYGSISDPLSQSFNLD